MIAPAHWSYDLRPPNPMKCMSWVGRPATAKLAGGPALAELPPKHVIPAKSVFFFLFFFFLASFGFGLSLE